jgi:hypothetical protein
MAVLGRAKDSRNLTLGSRARAVFEEAQQAFAQIYRSAERRPRCSRQDFAAGFLRAVSYLRAGH